MVFITLLSLFSFPETGKSSIFHLKIPNIDKVVHFMFYFVATILGCFFVREKFGKTCKFSKALYLIGTGAIIYGIIIEVLQSNFTVNRHGDIIDVIANSAGVLVAVFIAKQLIFNKSQLKWRN